ncbi:MAG TPA: hypothetical protein VN775_01300 [Opitutaceae bacterium]|nr:hypothetical protein [Opitutaceae bacterium]
MKSNPIPTIAIAAVLCAGCVGTGPNTQNGAVAGGALGALAGGIIGHNSRGGNTLGGAALGAVAGAIAGGTLGNAVDNQQGTVYRSEYEATSRVAVPQMPPPPAAQADYVTPQPTPSALWIAGYYNFDGYHYLWVPGHWEIPPPDVTVFVRPHWVYRGGQYVYIRGYWR